jgi:hypothetical protein
MHVEIIINILLAASLLSAIYFGLRLLSWEPFQARVVARIPFAFMAAGVLLPAGRYSFRHNPLTREVQVRNEETFRTIHLTDGTMPVGPSRGAEIYFIPAAPSPELHVARVREGEGIRLLLPEELAPDQRARA